VSLKLENNVGTVNETMYKKYVLWAPL